MLKFSHIYVETEALTYPISKELIRRFDQAQLIKIDDYRDIFNRNKQNWSAQKEAQKLILAVQKDKFYYEGSKNCFNFGHKHFYYSSSILNCPFDCSYCYLQGLFHSANIVFFVNQSEYFDSISMLLQEKLQLLLCLSYETDLIALDPILPTIDGWLNFAEGHPRLTLEIRTKATNCSRILRRTTLDNAIFAWTLSPQIVIEKYEKGAPALKSRLHAVKQAIEYGWKVRICIDPILFIPDWQLHYQELIEDLFSTVSAERIFDVSIGVFRMNLNYFKKVKKRHPQADFMSCDWQCREGTASYPIILKKQLTGHVLRLLAKHIPMERIYACER